MLSKRLTLPKSKMLIKPWEYNQVYRYGTRHRTSHFTLITAPNGSPVNRLGISIHGIKGVVLRNRIKRIIREFFRLNQDIFGIGACSSSNVNCQNREETGFPSYSFSMTTPGVDIVFAVRKHFSLNSPAEIKNIIKSIY